MNEQIRLAARSLQRGEVVAFPTETVYGLGADATNAEAIAKVPDELVDSIALLGPKERIRDRLEAWKASPVKTLLVSASQPEALRTLAELAL